jgi:hypothetical protein
VLSDGAVDISKVRPLLFDMSSEQCLSFGGMLGNCWNVGKALKRPKGD